MGEALPELGCYLLAGAGSSESIVGEARAAEVLGLGTAFISERWHLKEAAALSGAACASTSRINIATAATNHNIRHPLITASMATTLHQLSGGRFGLGLGRGVDRRWRSLGMPGITTAAMEDFAGLMRRLWAGETIPQHDGPAGSYSSLLLDPACDARIPLGLVAFGDRTLELAGRAFDYVVLHTFFTEETLRRCVRIVKESAERAGRNPDDVVVWSCFATVPDTLSARERLRKTVGRMGTYLQHYGDLMVSTNGWDPAVLAKFRADERVQAIRGPIDAVATDDQIEYLATLIPQEWLAPAGLGSPEDCARAVRRERELGADRVILHGVTPAEMAPVVEAYRALGAMA